MRRRIIKRRARKEQQQREYVFLLVSLMGLSVTFLLVFHVILGGSSLGTVKRRRRMITLDSLELTPSERTHYVSKYTQRNQTLSEVSKGKEALLQLLQDDAGFILDIDVIQLLPTWNEVTELYGSGPILRGCSSSSDPKSLGIAGMFGTGTNLASTYLKQNCQMTKNHKVHWEVPWGKHIPLANATSHYDNDILPVVILRDPYPWMASLCRKNYGAQWFHSKQHCPNLVPNEVDLQQFPSLSEKKSIPVRIQYPFGPVKWDSLIDLWTDWYQQYYHDTDSSNRVMIRYEDLLFFPHQTIQYLCEICAGGRLSTSDPFTYILPSAKVGPGHGQYRTNWMTALIRARWRMTEDESSSSSFTKDDLKFIQNYKEANQLMSAFHYPTIDP